MTPTTTSAPTVLVLGPLAVRHDDEVVPVAGTRRRCILALLASRVGEAVSVDAIIDAVWGDDPPPSAAKTVQSHLVRLRRSLAALGDDVIRTVPGGYLLDLPPDDVDAHRFERLVDAAHAGLADDAAEALARLVDADALWRGPAYLEFDEADFARAERARLDELRIRVAEDTAEARIAIGAAREAVAELESLTRTNPGRERSWELLVRALYASGRQQDALDALARARHELVEGFGVEPAAPLRSLEQQVLQQDPTLAPRAERLPTGLTGDRPLIRRADEVAWLEGAWRRAKAGRGQVRVVRGISGSGRTALVAELARRTVADGAWVEHHAAATWASTERRRLRRTTELEQTGPLVDAVVDRCRRGPTVVVVDDAEAADRDSLDLLRALCGAIGPLSLLLVVVVDPSGGGQTVHTVEQLAELGAVLDLAPLPDDAIIAIARDEGVDDDGAAAIAAVAHGLPAVALLEAAAWAEHAASERLREASRSSRDAAEQAGHATVALAEEVRALVRARSRRRSLTSAAWRGRQPFRSLLPYGPEDAEIFCGREQLVADLVGRVLDRRLVAVVGPSGIGKSSLVRAGLVPLALSGHLPGQRPWRVSSFVGSQLSIEVLDDLADVDPEAVGAAVHLVVVDQFEELVDRPGAEVAPIVDRLLDLAGDAALDLRVVITLRADAFGRLADHTELLQQLEAGQLTMGTPTADELARIVGDPAERTGCRIDQALVRRVQHDMATAPSALPLLSASLAEVWELRADDVLSLADYERIGGLATAVERLGDRAIAEAGIDAVRGVVLSLVDIDEAGAWRRRRRGADEVPTELLAAVDALVDARLITRRADDLEISHDVVLEAWPALVGWLDATRADLLTERSVERAARTWDDAGRHPHDLYRAGRLELTEEWAARHHDDLAPLTAAFLGASRGLAEREHEQLTDQLRRERTSGRRLRRLLAGVGALLLIAVVLSVVAVDNRRAADDERDRALVARLVAESGNELDSNLDLSLLLAVEGWRRAPSTATKGALWAALTHDVTAERDRAGSGVSFGGALHRTPSAFAGFVSVPTGLTWAVDVSDDGTTIVTAGPDPDRPRAGLLVVTDVRTGAELARANGPAAFSEAEITGDGRTVVASDRRSVLVLDVASATARRMAEAAGPAEEIAAMRLAPDGSTAWLTRGDGSVRAVSVATGAVVDVPLPPPPVLATSFTPDGTVLVERPGLAVERWDPTGGTSIGAATLERPPEPDPFDPALMVSADGRLVAGGEARGRLYVWDLASGRLVGDASRRPGTISGFAFSPVDPAVIVVTSGSEATIYDVAAERSLGTLRGSGGMSRIVFRDDGLELVTTDQNGTVTRWTDNAGPNLASVPIAPGVTNVVPAADGRHALVRVEPGSLEVRQLADLTRPGVRLTPPPGSGASRAIPIAVSDDGSRALGFVDPSGPYFVADGETGEPVWSSGAERSTVADLSPDGHAIVAYTDGAEPDLVVIDVETGATTARRDLAELRDDPDASFNGSVTFSADGSSLDVGYDQGIARLGLPDPSRPRWVPVDLHVSSNLLPVAGTDEVIAAGSDGTLGRWNLATGAAIAHGRSPDASVIASIAVSPDGALLAAYHGLTYELVLFDARTLTPLGPPMPVGDLVFTPAFDPNDGSLLTNGLFQSVTRTVVDPDAWASRACAAAGRNLTRQEWVDLVGGGDPYRPTCPQWPTPS